MKDYTQNPTISSKFPEDSDKKTNRPELVLVADNADRVILKRPWYTSSGAYHGSKYPKNTEQFIKIFPKRKGIAFPIAFDTEYVADSGELGIGKTAENRLGVTAQIKSITEKAITDGKIYVLPDTVELAAQDGRTDQLRHKEITHTGEDGMGEIIPLEYLKDRGQRLSYRFDESVLDNESPNRKLPVLLIPVYAHFLMVDMIFLVTGEYQGHMDDLFRTGKLEQKARLSVKNFGYVNMPCMVTLDGERYRLAFKPMDTIAVHGQASYAGLAKTVGVELPAKDYMKENRSEDGQLLIANMYETYFTHPEEYDLYALGDLQCGVILEKNSELHDEMVRELGISEYTKQPALTIGSTVADVICAIMYQCMGYAPAEVRTKKNRDRVMEGLTGKTTASHFTVQASCNEKYLGKTDGGRINNNRPTTVNVDADYQVDIDIAGAYTSAMSTLPFYVGDPNTVDFTGKEQSLGDTLKRYRKSFTDGGWVMRVSTVNDLKYGQDLIPSWTGESIEVTKSKDEDRYTANLKVDSGITKLYTHTIIHGIINSDTLQIIERVWSPKQRTDFYTKVRVDVLAYFPNGKTVTPEEWRTRTENPKHRSKDQGLNAEIPLGERLIDQLRATRSKFPKGTPQNTYAKLLGNTAYGVSVSRFFASSNMVFGNNITARVRAVMYLAEKGLNLYGSITDGQAFDLNKVTHFTSSRTPSERFYNMGTETTTQQSRLKGIAYKPLSLNVKTATRETIDEVALIHLQTLFPEMDCLTKVYDVLDLRKKNGIVKYRERKGWVTFESKRQVRHTTLHGSGNYLFERSVKEDNEPDPEKSTEILKMRSYEVNKSHTSYVLDETHSLVATGTFEKESPATGFMRSLKNTPTNTPFPDIFMKWAMVKPNDFANRQSGTWGNSNLTVGDTYPVAGLIRPQSLSQHNFRSPDQLVAWERAKSRLKRRYGYGFEMYFINKDGTLNYQEMIIKIQSLIESGTTNPTGELDANHHLSRRYKTDSRYKVVKHRKATLAILRSEIQENLKGDCEGNAPQTTEEQLAYSRTH